MDMFFLVHQKGAIFSPGKKNSPKSQFLGLRLSEVASIASKSYKRTSLYSKYGSWLEYEQKLSIL